MVPVAEGSFFTRMKITAIYKSHMEAGHLGLNYGYWKHASSDVKTINDACFVPYVDLFDIPEVVQTLRLINIY
ncbi:hypothetical protein L2634_04850 [Acinetobacter baumannii]|uniref:hypothetical protein n=1 Tax=Acinetobacter baumannii TaxID=470 RepID=UPI000B93A378|nr:hypothetical protein [Acinetobacter baumannii]MCR0059379.1 hypothetical protein [Acinetobacter baumannii]MCR0070899.1 hypothetical protein [Acinetobacter baumannii]MCR0086461.1 hypothetical protein [Acinetobacter baumannii]MDI2701340.1 hypothetical protein [Acinetobacter baumannii]NUF17676.1 hypothetical protein [Acinetobacter baumannii]